MAVLRRRGDRRGERRGDLYGVLDFGDVTPRAVVLFGAVVTIVDRVPTECHPRCMPHARKPTWETTVAPMASTAHAVTFTTGASRVSTAVTGVC